MRLFPRRRMTDEEVERRLCRVPEKHRMTQGDWSLLIGRCVIDATAPDYALIGFPVLPNGW